MTLAKAAAGVDRDEVVLDGDSFGAATECGLTGNAGGAGKLGESWVVPSCISM